MQCYLYLNIVCLQKSELIKSGLLLLELGNCFNYGDDPPAQVLPEL